MQTRNLIVPLKALDLGLYEREADKYSKKNRKSFSQNPVFFYFNMLISYKNQACLVW